MATYSAVPTVATGDWITAGWVNTYIGDNLAALWPGTTAGDMDYYSAANAKTRLAIGASGYILSSTGSAPSWVARPAIYTILLNTDVALVAGDDCYRFRIPAALDGWNLTGKAAWRKSGTGTVTLQIRNATTGFDLLSTRITMSGTDSTNGVIDTAHDDVAAGNQMAIDTDGAGTNTLYGGIELKFEKP